MNIFLLVKRASRVGIYILKDVEWVRIRQCVFFYIVVYTIYATTYLIEALVIESEPNAANERASISIRFKRRSGRLGQCAIQQKGFVPTTLHILLGPTMPGKT